MKIYKFFLSVLCVFFWMRNVLLMILVLFKNQSAVYGTVTQKQVSCKNCLYEWFFFSVSIRLFNFYSLHATVISWCTLFLEAAWKFTLEFPRLTLTIVLYFFFDFLFLSIVLLLVLFISLSLATVHFS